MTGRLEPSSIEVKMKSAWPNLRETVLLTAVAAIFFVVLNWAAACRCLGTLSDSLADVQDKTLDLVSRLEYRRYGPALPPDVPPVRLIQIDAPSVQQYSPASYVFNRGALAKLLEEIHQQKPKAIFIDLDLSNPSNEPLDGPQLSQGDQQLLAWFAQPRTYPILIPASRSIGATLLGQPLSQQGSWICPVSPLAIRDQDQKVRRIPRQVDVRDPYPAAEAMSQIARGGACPKPQEEPQSGNLYRGRDAYGGIGTRMVFRELEQWRALISLSASKVLAGQTPNFFENSVVLIGRVDAASLDFHPTPLGTLAGVVVHANELMTLLTYGRNVRALSPLVGVPLAFGLTLLVLLLTPLLSRVILQWLERLLARLSSSWKTGASGKLNFLERPLMWLSLFSASAVMLHRSGLFLDFVFPILSLELARIVREKKTTSLLTRLFRWVIRS